MGCIADLVHATGNVCRHAHCLRKMFVSTVILPTGLPSSAVTSERLASTDCPIYLAIDITGKTQTDPSDTGPRLLPSHTHTHTMLHSNGWSRIARVCIMTPRGLKGETIRQSSCQKLPSPSSLHGSSVYTTHRCLSICGLHSRTAEKTSTYTEAEGKMSLGTDTAINYTSRLHMTGIYKLGGRIAVYCAVKPNMR